MENASKALLIAGGVLLSLIIISIAMYIWSSGRSATVSMSKQQLVSMKEEQAAKFSQYIGDQMGSEIENCIRRVMTYNEKEPQNRITVNVTRNSVTNAYSSISNVVDANGNPIINIAPTYRNDIYRGTIATNANGLITSINFTLVLAR